MKRKKRERAEGAQELEMLSKRVTSLADGTRNSRYALESIAVIIAYILEHQHISLCMQRQDDDDKKGIALMG